LADCCLGIVEIQRKEKIFPELAFDAGIELHALMTGVAQPRVVLASTSTPRLEPSS
jgi:hypothetical protein